MKNFLIKNKKSLMTAFTFLFVVGVGVFLLGSGVHAQIYSTTTATADMTTAINEGRSILTTLFLPVILPFIVIVSLLGLVIRKIYSFAKGRG